MKNFMNTVKMSSPSLVPHNLSYRHKFSTNAGYIVPTMIQECVPNDRVKCGQSATVRLAPLVAPMMHDVSAFSHTFFVPFRLLWPNWESFIVDPQNLNEIEHPFFTVTNDNWTNWLGHFGIPQPPVGKTIDINPMVVAAANLIWDEYYRNQNLSATRFTPLVNGSNAANLSITQPIAGWEKDYFTSCLPFAQKGDPVELPVGVFEDVPVMRNNDDTSNFVIDGTVGGNPFQTAVPQEEASGGAGVQPDFLYAKTSLVRALAAKVNDLRVAKSVQELLEKIARAGSRYIEYLRGIFGAAPRDERLQRPEYVTGSVTPITVSAIPNTTGTDDAPQATLAGQGTGVVNSRFGYYQVKEHGYLITCSFIRPRTAYSQALNRTFIKSSPLDYYTPQLAHVGEEAVLNKEVNAFHNNPNETFGYQPRYSHLRVNNDIVSGGFATDPSLAPWTWMRVLSPSVALSDAFVMCYPDYSPFAVIDPDVDHFYINVRNELYMLRPIPKYGTPTF